MNKVIKRFKVYSFVVTLLVCLITIFLNISIDNIKGDLVNLQATIEDNLKDSTRYHLDYVKSQLESAIGSGELNADDDEAISKWVLGNSIFQNKHFSKGVSIVNIGYSPKDSNINLKLVIDQSDIEENMKVAIEKECNAILQTKGKSNSVIEQEIDQMAVKISSNSSFSYDAIRTVLLQCVFEKNKIIGSTIEEAIYDKEKTSYEVNTGNERLWIESVLIPSGTTGFNNEPLYKDSRENVKYKKIIIAVVMDADGMMSPYHTHIDDMNRLICIVEATLIITMIVVILFLYFKFKCILDKYNIGGDTNAETIRGFYTYINSVLRVNGVRIKQVWCTFRKKY